MSSIDALTYANSILAQYGKTTDSPGSGYATAKTLTDYLSETGTQESGSAQTPARTAKRNMQSYANAGITSDIGKAALNRALSEMQGKVDGTITFDKIYEYQKYLEAKFTVELKMEMTSRGVDPDQEFTIAIDTEGAISVECDDPDTKQAVQEYLDKNPKVCEEFGYIQALGNLQRAQQSSVWPGLRNVKSEIVASAIEAMFDETLASGTMDFAALTAKFNGSGTNNDAQFYTGLSFTV